MDISELKYIIAIEEYRNISDAASSCNVSQSVLSKHLSKLESEIGGIALFNRSKRPLTLTPAGEEFIQFARRIVEEHDELVKSMFKYLPRSDSYLRIGSIPVMGRMGIDKLLEDFREQYNKDLEINVVDRPSLDLLDLLESGDIDAAVIITSPEMKLNRKFTLFPIHKNTLKLAVNLRHRFANRSSVSISELRNEIVALADERTGMFPITSRVLTEAKVNTNNIRKYRNIDTVINEVLSNRAVSFLSETLASSYENTGIKLINIDKKIQSTTALVINNSHHMDKTLKDFVDYVIDSHQ